MLGRQYVVEQASAEVAGTICRGDAVLVAAGGQSSASISPRRSRATVMSPARSFWLESALSIAAPISALPIARRSRRPRRRGPAAILLDDRQSRRRPFRLQRHAGGCALAGAGDRGRRARRAVPSSARSRRARRSPSTSTGHYERDVAGRNVIARLGIGAGPTIVVSTPMTGWYTCVCERGPGIANFLALARTRRCRKMAGAFRLHCDRRP